MKDEVRMLPTKYQKEENTQSAVEMSMKLELQGEEHQSKKRKRSVPNAMIQDFFVTERLLSESANETTRFKPVRTKVRVKT